MADKTDNKLVSNGVYSILADTWLKEPVASEIPDINQADIDKEVEIWEARYNDIVDRAEKELIGFTPDAPNNEAEKTSETAEPDSACDGEGCARTEKIISDQIRGEWEAIRNYQQAIDDLEQSNMDFNNVIKLLDDISDEELVHVGELTQALTTIKTNTSTEIDKGVDEAEEKLANPVPTESLTEEVHTDLIDAIDSFLDEIYIARQDGLNTDGEYATNNLVFKELRNKGYFDKLKDIKNQLISKELSVKDTDKKETHEEPAQLEEGTEKVKDGEWVNKGAEGMHGKFKTKKAADAQRRAMFANGFHEDIEKTFKYKATPSGLTGKIKAANKDEALKKARDVLDYYVDASEKIEIYEENGSPIKERIDERTKLNVAEEQPKEEKRRKYWLAPKQRYEYRIELSRISHNSAIIQENGLFNIYNVQERDVQQILMRIRQLDYIEWVQETPGAYDFSHPEFGRPQPRYHQIYGKIKTD